MIHGIEEIGSNFWMSPEQIERCSFTGYDDFVKKYPNYFFTSSGRGAMKFLLESLSLEKHLVLLPNYTCESVVKPFSDLGYDVYFYKVNSDFGIDINELYGLIARYKPCCVLFQSYFGFDTLNNTRKHYESIKAKGCVVVEDITHSVFSTFPKSNADFYVCSLRKWLEIPDGAFVSFPASDINQYSRYKEHREIVDAFIQASKLKTKYFDTGDLMLKDAYRNILNGVNNILDEEKEDVYKISKEAVSVLAGVELEELVNRRRQNFQYIQTNLHINDKFLFAFRTLPEAVVPLFFPVFIKNGQRDCFQQYMAEHRVYCPVHWGTPSVISEKCRKEDLIYQYEILSIPCDQRYSLKDMERLVTVANNFKW